MTFTVTSRMSFCFLKTYFHEKPVGLKQKTNSSKINTAKTGLFIFVHFKCTHCLNFVSLHLTFLFIAYLFTLLNFTYGILTLIYFVLFMDVLKVFSKCLHFDAVYNCYFACACILLCI